MNNIFELLNPWNNELFDIQGDEIKKWLRIEDPTENYKDSLKK
jgi:hypothetical protein